jgi:hypothetical protein
MYENMDPRLQDIATVMQLASNLSIAGAQRASSRFLSGGDPRPVVRRAKDAMANRGVREALQTSRSYVTGLWRRLNGQLGPEGPAALPFGMLSPLSKAGACSTLLPIFP